ncbi:hypothetical protein PBAL39_11787 [Pedobacter sp. BAL39]|nr:hypothetical protein PBAL39_11787 [Pedobacter sp. BAL39]
MYRMPKIKAVVVIKKVVGTNTSGPIISLFDDRSLYVLYHYDHMEIKQVTAELKKII